MHELSPLTSGKFEPTILSGFLEPGLLKMQISIADIVVFWAFHYCCFGSGSMSMPEKLASPDDEKQRGQFLKPFCEICRKPISGISGIGTVDKPVTLAGRLTNWFSGRSFCSCRSTGTNSQVVALYEKGLARKVRRLPRLECRWRHVWACEYRWRLARSQR